MNAVVVIEFLNPHVTRDDIDQAFVAVAKVVPDGVRVSLAVGAKADRVCTALAESDGREV